MNITLLLDEQLIGYRTYCARLLHKSEYREIALDLGIRFVNFPDVGLEQSLSDEEVWNYCVKEGYILLTDNRNSKGDESLARVIERLGRPSDYPAITIGDRIRFSNDQAYALSVVDSIVEQLFDIDQLRGTGRIFVPSSPYSGGSQ